MKSYYCTNYVTCKYEIVLHNIKIMNKCKKFKTRIFIQPNRILRVYSFKATIVEGWEDHGALTLHLCSIGAMPLVCSPQPLAHSTLQITHAVTRVPTRMRATHHALFVPMMTTMAETVTPRLVAFTGSFIHWWHIKSLFISSSLLFCMTDAPGDKDVRVYLQCYSYVCYWEDGGVWYNSVCYYWGLYMFMKE